MTPCTPTSACWHQRNPAIWLVRGRAGPRTWVLTPGPMLIEKGEAAASGGDLTEFGALSWQGGQCLISLTSSFVAMGATSACELQRKGNNSCFVGSLCLDLLVLDLVFMRRA